MILAQQKMAGMCGRNGLPVDGFRRFNGMSHIENRLRSGHASEKP